MERIRVEHRERCWREAQLAREEQEAAEAAAEGNGEEIGGGGSGFSFAP